jgi:hypothetical protein
MRKHMIFVLWITLRTQVRGSASDERRHTNGNPPRVSTAEPAVPSRPKLW